jgi:hypothetical protein
MKNKNYKTGDVVLFSLAGENEVKLYNEVGVVIKINEQYISIFKLHNSIRKVNIDNIRPFSDLDKCIKEIEDNYNDSISKYEAKIKSVKNSDYQKEYIDKYYNIKNQIINTAKNMIEIDENNDDDFENKLKAICQKKKDLFSITCDGIDEARKHNGEMKYYIKDLTNKRDRMIEDLKRNIEKLKSEL